MKIFHCRLSSILRTEVIRKIFEKEMPYAIMDPEIPPDQKMSILIYFLSTRGSASRRPLATILFPALHYSSIENIFPLLKEKKGYNFPFFAAAY